MDLCSSGLSACCCTPAQSYIGTPLIQMRQTRLSRLGMETSFKRDYEIVSYGGGVEVKNIVKRRDKRANLVWGWRIFCSEQARLSHMGVGQGHTPYNPHDITYLTNLLGSFARSLRRSIRVRAERPELQRSTQRHTACLIHTYL